MTTAATCAFGEVSRSPSYYRGEQYDPDLGLYYLRARYYNTMTDRFVSMDPGSGAIADPKSLHKYLYAGGNPVNAKDPTGRSAIADTALLDAALFTAAIATYSAAKTNPTALVGALHELSDTVGCGLQLDACMLTSLADKPGSVWGESRCLSCYKLCLAYGTWPWTMPTTSGGKATCKYW